MMRDLPDEKIEVPWDKPSMEVVEPNPRARVPYRAEDSRSAATRSSYMPSSAFLIAGAAAAGVAATAGILYLRYSKKST